MKIGHDKSITLSDGTVFHLYGADAQVGVSGQNVKFFVHAGLAFPVAWVSWIRSDGRASTIQTIQRSGWYKFYPNLDGILERTPVSKRETGACPGGI